MPVRSLGKRGGGRREGMGEGQAIHPQLDEVPREAACTNYYTIFLERLSPSTLHL